MRFGSAILVLLACFCSARLSLGAGPKNEPEKYVDYGGTPDLRLSGDIQMSDTELEALLAKLNDNSLKVRIDAAIEIQQSAAGVETVYRKALWHSGSVRHRDIKEVLQRAGSQKDSDGGIMGALLRLEPRTDAVNMATRVVTLLVALHSQNTMAGYKVLLDFSGRYAGAFRALIGELMVHAGMKALPALIYGRGSKNKELHMFAVAWIREMGNPLLSEQIRGIQNSRRLAQLLEAYASVNELDAIDVTLSLANHDSGIVRKAARACLEVYGRNAKWSIHREYENAFGDEPEDGDYQEWAAALYKAWDTQRESRTIALFRKGVAAAKSGDFKTMDTAYRELLSMAPLNPHRDVMARGYLAYAARLEFLGNQADALQATRMARRLSEEGAPEYKDATARLKWLHAEALRSSGALDVAAYRDLAKQPRLHKDAAQWAAYGQNNRKGKPIRWYAVIIVSLLIFVSALLLYWRVRARLRY